VFKTFLTLRRVAAASRIPQPSARGKSISMAMEGIVPSASPPGKAISSMGMCKIDFDFISSMRISLSAHTGKTSLFLYMTSSAVTLHT
jgi:hypothetical protein